nr:aldo/keto reductase [Ardenticatena sp.]
MLVPNLFFACNGLTVSRIVQGMRHLAAWCSTVEERRDVVEFCLEHGIHTFDHADMYGGSTCEALFGEVLAEAPYFNPMFDGTFAASATLAACPHGLVASGRRRALSRRR